MTVAEVTYSNSISVSEHAVMQILTLVHNYLPAHDWVTAQKGWNIADSVSRAYDIEGMDVGVLGSGRIGQAVLRRLKPFGVTLHYCDVHRLPKGVEEELGLTYHPDVRSLASSIDVLSIHTPLHPQTQNLFDEELIGAMKRGAYIVNTARALIVNRDAVVRALNSGQLAGYAGDVWYPQPPPPDHPWRTMPYEAMTPHVSGSTLSAQARYAMRRPGDPGVLARRAPRPPGVPDRRRRRARRGGSTLVHGRLRAQGGRGAREIAGSYSVVFERSSTLGGIPAERSTTLL